MHGVIEWCYGNTNSKDASGIPYDYADDTYQRTRLSAGVGAF